MRVCCVCCVCFCVMRVCVDTCCVLGSPQLLATPGHHHGVCTCSTCTPDMIQTIQEQALLCADVLEKTVRGIRPRVGALASPRESEPLEYVLVLADIIKANDPDRTAHK